MNAFRCVRPAAAAGLFICFSVIWTPSALAQQATPPSSGPQPLGVPQPGPQTGQPYDPQPILPGGIVLALYPPDSPLLNTERLHEAEQYTLTRGTPGRIQSIVNIHNPSIEVHTVAENINTGAAIILAAGGGHRTLNVGTEAGDFVHYFYNFGVNTIILRNRLRSDGYSPQADAVHDALQAIRLVRARAGEWGIDPNKIGMMGFSAGAELAAPAAILFEDFDAENNQPSDPLAGVSSRPDFVGLIYPGPTPFARGENPAIPKNAPPAFIASAAAGDRVHAIWADEYFSAMLQQGIPNIEMHLYGNGVHANGLKDRSGTPFGTWQDRFVDWFRDLRFLEQPGQETKAAQDIAAFVSQPPPRQRGFRGGRGGGPRETIQPPAAGSDRSEFVSTASYVIGTYTPAASNHSPMAIAFAANRFLGSLRQDQRRKVAHQPDSPERSQWTNVPPRPDAGGLRLGDCKESQVKACCDLLAALFSQQGYSKMCNIMLADDQLLRGRPRPGFGTDNFSVVIFGTPSASEPWGFQLDGHHVAVNLSLQGDKVSMSPSFIGTQPEAFQLAMKDFRPLSGEIDTAFRLVDSLSDEQLKAAVVSNKRGDIKTGPGHDHDVPTPQGIRCSELTAAQRDLLVSLISEWVNDLPAAHAERRLGQLKTELNETFFAWNGPRTAGSDVSYTIQGPSLILEYACQDLGGNPLDHLHTMYRDPTNEYGGQIE